MDELKSLHKLEFGVEPDIIVSAPGTFNLMGEHTDYSEGFVLQAALNRVVRIAINKREDNLLRFYSTDFNERKRTSLPNLKYKREDRWANYPKGVLYELMQLGHEFGGFNLSIRSEIPPGIGLGASAAICTATAKALNDLFTLRLSNIQLIQVAGMAESVFWGLRTELTDQYVATMAKRGKALFIDIRELTHKFLPLNFKDKTFVLTNSNVPLPDIDPEIEYRLDEARTCLDALRRRHTGHTLRDYTIQDLQAVMGDIPEQTRRLCTHVIVENRRVPEAFTLLENEDFEAFGKMMSRSHESLRDNYEVSCPELDWLVKRAVEIDGVYGSRLTGPGFGGCTITLLDKDAVDEYITKITEYERIFGFGVEIFECKASTGVKVEYRSKS